MLGTSRPALPFSIRLRPADYSPAELLRDGWQDETQNHRVIGAHFQSWAREAYGDEAWRAWIWSDGVLDGNTAEQAFDSNFDEPLSTAVSRWHREAEDEVLFSDLCYGVDAPALPPEGLHVTTSDVCCEDDSTEQVQPPYLALGRRCFTLNSGTDLRVEFLSGDGQLVLRPDGCEDERVVLEAGQSEMIAASACRWHVLVTGEFRCGTSDTVEYRITPY